MTQTKRERERVVERGIVRALIGHMAHKGWIAWRTWDGEQCQYALDGHEHVDSIMAPVFNLDEVSIRFAPRVLVDTWHAAHDGEDAIQAKGACKRAEHGVLLVMGNAEHIISDWNYSDGDADRFNAAMDTFFAQDGEAYGRDMVEVGQRYATDIDRASVLAGSWLRDGDALAVLFKGREGLRRVGKVRGYSSDSDALAKADTLLLAANLSAERISIAEVDAFPGGWRKRFIVAHS